MKNARKPIAAVLALGAVLAMPLALAQSAVTPEVREAQKAAVESAAAAQATQDAAQPAPTSVTLTMSGHTFRVSTMDSSKEWRDPEPAWTVTLPVEEVPAS